MTTVFIILSLTLYVFADYHNWLYKTVGNIRNSELFKWGMIGCIVCCILLPPKIVIVLVWFLWHYPTQQIGQGWLRHRNPLYLGSGDFDKFVKWATGGRKWLYILSMVLSLILGLWLYLQYYY